MYQIVEPETRNSRASTCATRGGQSNFWRGLSG